MPYRDNQDGQVIVKSSDKWWSIGEGNGKLHQYSCQENPMNNTKRQKNMTPEDGSLRSDGEGRGQILIAPERISQLGQSGNDNQLWICL